MARGEYTIAEAADRARVDRSTVMKLRTVARQGALDALAASKPGVRSGGGPDPELAAARAEIDRLTEALKEMGVDRARVIPPQTTAGVFAAASLA